MDAKDKFLELTKTGTGRIVATIVLLFLGPPGWILIAIMWGTYFFSKKKE